MGPFELLHCVVDALHEAPGVRHLRKRRFDREFENGQRVHLFRGVYGSFEAALAAVPATRPASYDNAAAASMYDRRLAVEQTDYPAMFWLAHALQDGARSVFDLGGHIGIKYYAFRECIGYPDDLRWTVCDLPAVIERGARLARERGVQGHLRFTGRAGDAEGCDVLYASGSLQYLPYTFTELLAGLADKPRTVVVNITPLHDSRSFFTLNAIGTAICPYRVSRRGEFLEGVLAQGYAVRDHWLNVGKGMTLPFETGYDVEAYSGFFFDRSAEKKAAG